MRSLVLTLVCGAFLLAAPVRAAPEAQDSHKMVGDIKVKSSDGKHSVQTMCLDAKGNVVALAAPPRAYGVPAKDVSSEIFVFSPEGKELSKFVVNFHAHAVNTAADGKIYVGGDGKLARYDATGKLLDQFELPHIKAALNDPSARAKAEEQLKQQADAFETNRKRIVDLKEKLEAKKEEDRTATEKNQLRSYEQVIKSYEQTAEFYKTRKVEDILAQTTGRLRIINGLAISEKDVFVVCGESAGYGYAVWRLDPNLENPKQVMAGLSGCCGQMDIQVSGTDLLVAENTKHRFARYDRDGKALGAWGTRGKETDPGCFGGCCNPMNLRAIENGDVFTAESEGIVKRFSARGDFIATVAFIKLTGGCKNVSVAANPSGDLVYFCDMPGSRIIMLKKKAGEKKPE